MSSLDSSKKTHHILPTLKGVDHGERFYTCARLFLLMILTDTFPVPKPSSILTFFLYLSDVEEGGATNFPDLNIAVKPKVGRALLWPSVLDSNPMDKEPRTDHEAQDVVRGLKFGANGKFAFIYALPCQSLRTNHNSLPILNQSLDTLARLHGCARDGMHLK